MNENMERKRIAVYLKLLEEVQSGKIGKLTEKEIDDIVISRLKNSGVETEYEEGIAERNKIAYPYAVRCADCGKVYGRKRMCKVIETPESFCCSCCHGKLKRIK